jgi:oligosaccharide repeat unit polymerase
MNPLFLSCSILVVFTVLYYSLFKHFWSPSLLVLIWWVFWFSVTVSTDIGFPKPSNALLFSFYAFLFFFALGSLLPAFLHFTLPVPNNDCLLNFNNTMIRVWSVISLPVLFYFWIKAARVLSEDSFLGGRNALIDFEGSTHPVFGSSFIRNVVEVFMAGPLLYFSLFAFVYLIRDSRVLLSSVTCLGIYLYQSTELGRSQIYRTALLLFAVFFFLWIYRKFVLSTKKLFLVLLVSLVFFCYVFSSTMSRFKNNPSASWTDVATELQSYHTVGFILYDLALNDPNSPLNTEIGFGRATFSGLWFPVTQVIRMFDKTYISFLDEWYPYTAISHDLGIRTESGKEFLFNAYYTMLFPFFLDFRYPGICFFSLLLGFSASTCFLNWRKSFFDFWFVTFMLLLVFCIMNIFQPLTQRVYFFAASFLLIFSLFRIKKAQ